MQRKVDHLNLALGQTRDPGAFADFHLVHNCLPGLSIAEVNPRVDLLGFRWNSPLYINALTGGHSRAVELNCILGGLASSFGLPIAVGSQSAAILDPKLISTYTAIRHQNPDGPVWANLSAGSSLSDMAAAIDMVGASALQLHLNAPQEIAQPEGNKSFEGWLENIALACQTLNVPIIVKEVGFGMAREEVALLVKAGVSALDCSGRGGTDFLRIEQERYPGNEHPLAGILWGIPTPLSVMESVSSAGGVPVLASGGVDTALEAIICLRLGARAVGVGRALLQAIDRDGESGGDKFIKNYLHDLKLLLALQGCKDTFELMHRPLIIHGFAKEWIEQRKLELIHA